ncbi:MAG: DUF3108 domain-containing protein [Nitrospiraceae bacterium]|nr:DUF3108 domain-containing protein [Nitrospiraceae bacterium]
MIALAAPPLNGNPAAALVESPSPAISKNAPAFAPGERLTYNVSWSNVFSAGTSVMEVLGEKSEDGRPLLLFRSTAKSIGVVDRFYPVKDVVESLVDPRTFESISYHLDQSHGSRKRKRTLVFDHQHRTVTYTMNGSREVFDIPEHTLDALSALYYVRAKEPLEIGRTIVVPIHDSGKNWTVEIFVLKKEKVETPAGTFNTVMVKTYPKYEGVFMHKGEIFMWLTDDNRKIPVQMKSTITIGSVMATLTEMKLGDEAR